ncbi:MAG: NAD(P)/FAD-dependent oxidoreductase [Candidatus Altiarchaeota archaeon]|nr:NAD(P)/FAD-dependent oxidoreductase [Candidatus Altiarchaeota archaeon]
MNIIGGGPVGLWAAKKLADAGYKVTVHEAHSKIGEPEHCTGLLSNGIDKILEPEVVIQYIGGARFFAGDKQAIIERKKVAKVIDRVEFDKQVYGEAVSSGAEVKLNSHVNWKNFKGNVIAADGAFGSTRTDFNQKTCFLPAMQFDIRERPTENFVELWFEPWNPDYFIWVVPRGDRIRVGTAAKDLRPLKNFVIKRFGRFRLRSRYAGLVLTSGPVKKTVFELKGRRIFLVGDSAGQVKPTTGGGVIMGMTCAEKLSEAFESENPKSYEKLWRAEIGNELKLQKLARWAMTRNSAGFIDFLRKAKYTLEDSGDMDFQMRSLSKLMAPAFSLGLSALFNSPKNRKDCIIPK